MRASLCGRKENVYPRPVARTFPDLFSGRCLFEIATRMSSSIYDFPADKLLWVLKNIHSSVYRVKTLSLLKGNLYIVSMAWQPTYYGHGHKQPNCRETQPKKIVTHAILLKGLNTNPKRLICRSNILLDFT